jgi:hypothetical protein
MRSEWEKKPMAEKKRTALVLDRDPFEQNGQRSNRLDMGDMKKIADADLVLVVKGDEAKIIKFGVPGTMIDPMDYEVEVMRP